MNSLVKISLVACAICMFIPTSYAASINDRQDNQQQRIEQGIRSGELTKKEAKKLAKNQRHIAKTEAKFKSDGVLTKKERAILHNKQDKASKRIFKQKHDAQKR